MNPDRNHKIRPPAWAGAFYPADPFELRQQVQKLLDEVDPVHVSGHLWGLIVPHAGYVYSGRTAAHGYRLVQGQKLKTVFVLAPSHAEWFNGVAVYGGDEYTTPLGSVTVDQVKVKALTDRSDLISISESGHRVRGDRAEHSLEVQLPFLQVALAEPFRLVAIVFHDYRASVCKALGLALASVIEDTDLMVASTDLYHGYSYDECRRSDDATLQAMMAFDPDAFCAAIEAETVQACGAGPVAALLYAAKEKKADKVQLLHQTNSADVTGTHGGWTVGYAGLSVSECRNT